MKKYDDDDHYMEKDDYMFMEEGEMAMVIKIWEKEATHKNWKYMELPELSWRNCL